MTVNTRKTLDPIQRLWMPLAILLALLQGCAGLPSGRVAAMPDRPPACQQFLLDLDEMVEKAGVTDASSFQVPGFPYLRTSRFLAAMKHNAMTDSKLEQWLGLMRELSSQARAREISNLPEPVVAGWQSTFDTFRDRGELSARAEACAAELFRHDKSRPVLSTVLSDSIRIPDEYSPVLRTVGLYPITTIPMDLLGERMRRKFRKWYATDLEDLPVSGELRWLAPPEGAVLSRKALKRLLDSASSNALSIPLPGDSEKEELARTFAPAYLQDVAAPYDLPGRMRWRRAKLVIDTRKPTVYYYFSHAILHGRPILQIVYVLWFPKRAGASSPFLERGDFDGLTARVSLDGDGNVFMVDMMNNCGCYHFFVPKRDLVERTIPNSLALDPFVPQWLPDTLGPGGVSIRIMSGWHQVQRLFADAVPENPVRYELIPYEEIENLPDDEGGSRSVFNSAGILKGSDRIEPLLLFPAGIHSIGSMRQRGHHAIEFRGRAHFDDPYLFEESFVFKPGAL